MNDKSRALTAFYKENGTPTWIDGCGSDKNATAHIGGLFGSLSVYRITADEDSDEFFVWHSELTDAAHTIISENSFVAESLADAKQRAAAASLEDVKMHLKELLKIREA